MQARSLYLIAPQQLAWVVEDLPPLKPDEILVQTTTGAMSIGAELPQYRGIERGAYEPRYPRMTGYESVGRVLACGSAVQHLHVGQRVVAFYGHRTQAIVPVAKAIPVPDDIVDELAILAILTCDVAKGIAKVQPQAHEAILITGAGAIGTLTFYIVRMQGIATVDIVEPNVKRHAFVQQLGVRVVTTPQSIQGNDERYPVGFECSSHNRAFALLQTKMQHNGRICILADGNIEPLVLTPDFHAKELSIVGSSDGLDYSAHARWYFHVLQTRTNMAQIVHIFDYHTTASGLIATFAKLADGTITPVKVLVHYNTDEGYNT